MSESEVVVLLEANNNVPVSSKAVSMILNGNTEKSNIVIIRSKSFEPVVSNFLKGHRKSFLGDLGESHEEHVQGKLVDHIDRLSPSVHIESSEVGEGVEAE